MEKGDKKGIVVGNRFSLSLLHAFVSASHPSTERRRRREDASAHVVAKVGAVDKRAALGFQVSR
jgi:hypothetical protein